MIYMLEKYGSVFFQFCAVLFPGKLVLGSTYLREYLFTVTPVIGNTIPNTQIFTLHWVPEIGNSMGGNSMGAEF